MYSSENLNIPLKKGTYKIVSVEPALIKEYEKNVMNISEKGEFNINNLQCELGKDYNIKVIFESPPYIAYT